MARRDAATRADSVTRPAPEVPFWLLPTLAGLLLFSGVCALVYQVLWLRLLSLTFGVTTYAASTVLASFMGGLAVGSFVAGKVADRVRRPLFLFGLVELLIGVCALATPAALAGVHRLFVEVAGRLPDSLAIGTVVRLVLSFAVLLVPTALMGATLPIVVKSSLYHAGANNLNSVEYFRLVRDRLAPDGIALHWNGGVTDAEYKMILRAFVDAFPEATLWGDGTLMIGSKRPLTVSQARIEALLADPAARQALALMHVGSFDHLVRMFRASPRDISAYLGPGSALSDDKPALEYFASLPQDERDLGRLGRDSSAVVRP